MPGQTIIRYLKGAVFLLFTEQDDHQLMGRLEGFAILLVPLLFGFLDEFEEAAGEVQAVEMLKRCLFSIFRYPILRIKRRLEIVKELVF